MAVASQEICTTMLTMRFFSGLEELWLAIYDLRGDSLTL
jgi:hypothetical protein